MSLWAGSLRRRVVLTKTKYHDLSPYLQYAFGSRTGSRQHFYLACSVEQDESPGEVFSRPRAEYDDDNQKLEGVPTSLGRKRGRPRKTNKDKAAQSAEIGKLNPIIAGSDKHNSLKSFLDYAEKTGLDQSTTVYVGLHYEYTVIESLKRLKFELTRTGRSSDLGIDLVGHWTLPAFPSATRVLLQCKKEKPQPKHIRELEGAFIGAPAGWRGEGVTAFLVAAKEATKGTRDAISRSRWPIGFLNITTDGIVKQLLWNQKCTNAGLEGVGVGVRHRQGERDTAGDEEITLLWDGRPVR